VGEELAQTPILEETSDDAEATKNDTELERVLEMGIYNSN
jgi:hypothetical protein